MANYFLAFTIGCGCALTYAAWSVNKKIFSKYHLIPKQNFMVKPMPLSASALASLIKEKLDAQPPGTAGEANLQALAEAIVEHIKTNGVVRIDGVQPGSGTVMGGIK